MKSNNEFFSMFVSKILEIPYEAIEFGEFVDNEPVTEHKDDTHHRVDIVFEADDKLVNLEANRYTKGIASRNNKYIYRIILNKSMLKNKKGKAIKDFYQINIDEANFYFNKKLINRFETREIENGIKLPFTPVIIHVALAYLKKEEYTKDIDSWLLSALKLFEASSKEEYKKIIGKDKILGKVMMFMESYSKKQEIVNEFLDEQMAEYEKEYDLNNAREEGFQNGFQNGEKNKTLETAKKMLEKSFDINDIAEVTGLTKEEIENLK